MRDFDYIVVGGSPAMIARAVQMASRGRSVAVLDSEPEVGGSWRLRSPFGDGRRYDCFEHYLAGGPAAKTLLGELGIPLQARPLHYFFPDGLTGEEKALVEDLFKPECDLDGTFLPTTEGSFVTRYRRGTISAADIDKLRLALGKPRWRAIRRAKDVSHFFMRNVDDLLDPLMREAARHEVEFLLEHRVASIRSDADGVTIDGDFGSLRADGVLLGRHYDGELAHEGTPVPFKRVPDQRRTVLLRVAAEAPQPYRYVKFGNWNLWRSIQDVSIDEAEGQSTFGLFHGLTKNRDAADLVAILVEIGVLHPGSRLLDQFWLQHHFSSGISAIANRLANITEGRVEALCFASLGREIGDNPDVWRVALGGTGQRSTTDKDQGQRHCPPA